MHTPHLCLIPSLIVIKILNYYEQILSIEEKGLLQLVSCFRSSVTFPILKEVFREMGHQIDDKQFINLVNHLENLKLVNEIKPNR